MHATIRHLALWSGLAVLMVLLLATGCSSQGDPIASPVATAAIEAESLASGGETTVPPPPSPIPSRTPSSTPVPTATATPTPPPSATPSPTAVPATPTPTPAPALIQLTTGGCCTQPFWSPDSQQVLFIDKPAPEAPAGIWGVPLAAPGTEPQLYSERIGLYGAGMTYLIEPINDTTFIEHLSGPTAGTAAARWSVPAGGHPVVISPGATRIAWEVTNDLPVEQRITQIWVANLDGSDPRQIATLPRGGLSGWVSDDVLLLSARESLESRTTLVYTFSLTDARSVELIRAERPRGMDLSPDRRWLAYFISLSDEPAENGLWLVRTDGSERLQLDRELFGAYQWRDAARLIIIPFHHDAVHHELWEFDVDQASARRLTDPAVTPFKIANGDWQVSPDGRHVAFVEGSNRNVWVLALPD